MKPVSKRLRAWRRRFGLTQSGAAAALGVSLRSIENWEQGRNTPRGLALESLTTKLQNPPEK